MARPKQVISRYETVKIRVSPLEKKALTLIAERTGLTVSEFIRRCSFNQEVKVRFSREELEAFKDLHQFRNHFSSISNALKGRKATPVLIAEIEALRDAMQEQLKKFKS